MAGATEAGDAEEPEKATAAVGAAGCTTTAALAVAADAAAFGLALDRAMVAAACTAPWEAASAEKDGNACLRSSGSMFLLRRMQKSSCDVRVTISRKVNAGRKEGV